MLSSPVVLLLDGGSQLLVEALQVCETHQQGVPLRPDQLLSLANILHLPVPCVKSAQEKYNNISPSTDKNAFLGRLRFDQQAAQNNTLTDLLLQESLE